MCETCWAVAGKPAIINDKVKLAVDLIKELYDTEDGGVGGYGHIVFDDWNVDDSDIEYCLTAARGGGYEFLCDECRSASLKALNMFKELTEEERYSALALADGFISIPQDTPSN